MSNLLNRIAHVIAHLPADVVHLVESHEDDVLHVAMSTAFHALAGAAVKRGGTIGRAAGIAEQLAPEFVPALQAPTAEQLVTEMLGGHGAPADVTSEQRAQLVEKVAESASAQLGHLAGCMCMECGARAKQQQLQGG